MITLLSFTVQGEEERACFNMKKLSPIKALVFIGPALRDSLQLALGCLLMKGVRECCYGTESQQSYFRKVFFYLSCALRSS